MLGENLANSTMQGYNALKLYDGDFVDVGTAPTGYGQYDQLFANNPYRNLTYKKSAWQDFASWMGFRTKADDFVEQARINAQEYDASIFSMMQQNQYNSPEQQALRERAAGLNPDILGLGDSVAAAQPADDPNGMNVSPTDDMQPLNIIQTVSSSVMGLIPKILSFSTQLSQLRGIRADNDLKQLQFGTNAVDAATKFFVEGITESDYRAAFDTGNWDNILDASRKDAKYLADTFLSSKRARKAFNLAYGMHANSLIGMAQKYGTFDDFEKNRKSILTQRSSQFFSDDDEAMMKLLKSVNGPLERWQKKMNEINERYANKAAALNLPEDRAVLEDKQIANQQVYENAIDPELQAKSENTANEYQTQQNEIMAATNDLFAEMMAALDEEDAWYSSIGKTLIGIARAFILSNMQISFGRRQQINPKTGQIENVDFFGFGM